MSNIPIIPTPAPTTFESELTEIAAKAEEVYKAPIMENLKAILTSRETRDKLKRDAADRSIAETSLYFVENQRIQCDVLGKNLELIGCYYMYRCGFRFGFGFKGFKEAKTCKECKVTFKNSTALVAIGEYIRRNASMFNYPTYQYSANDIISTGTLKDGQHIEFNDTNHGVTGCIDISTYTVDAHAVGGEVVKNVYDQLTIAVYNDLNLVKNAPPHCCGC